MWMRWFCGVVLIVLGVVWFGQGINVLGGSSMSGNAFWALVGAPMVVVGIVLIGSASRSRRGSAPE